MGLFGLFGPSIKKMEKKEDIEGLTKALKHEKYHTRERAAAALDRLSWEPKDKDERAWFLAGQRAWQNLIGLGEPALPPLIRSLTHPEGNARATVAESLEQVAIRFPDSSVPKLCAAINGPLIGMDNITTEARNRVVEILAKIGDPRATAPLVKSYAKLNDLEVDASQKMAYRDQKSEYWKLVEQTIMKIGDPAVDPLIDLLQERDEDHPHKTLAQDMTALALGALGSEAIDPLINLLNNEDRSVRKYAITALCKIDDDRVINPLVNALKDKYKLVRESAVSRLIELHWDPVNSEQKAYFLLASLLRASSPHSGASFKTIFEELVGMGETAIDPMIQSLDLEGSVWTRLGKKATTVPANRVVITVLSEIGEPALSYLQKIVTDQDQSKDVQEAALQAMKNIHRA